MTRGKTKRRRGSKIRILFKGHIQSFKSNSNSFIIRVFKDVEHKADYNLKHKRKIMEQTERNKYKKKYKKKNLDDDIDYHKTDVKNRLEVV